MHNKFILTTLLVISLLFNIKPSTSFSAQQPRGSQFIIKLSNPYGGGSSCIPGPKKQPIGPFAILVFCEGELGNYITLYYEKAMHSPVSTDFPKWSFNDRIWQDKSWGSDVTGFVWSPSGKFLYVATSSIYGIGGLYEIDLANRTAKLVFPLQELKDNGGFTIEIMELNEKNFILKIRESIYDGTDNKPITSVQEIKIK